MPTREQTRAQQAALIVPGLRVSLSDALDRYPHFLAPKGMTGTVVDVDQRMVVVRMDMDLPGSEEWGNAIHFYAEDCDTSATEPPTNWDARLACFDAVTFNHRAPTLTPSEGVR